MWQRLHPLAIALAAVVLGCDGGADAADAARDGAVDGGVIVAPGVTPPAEPSPPELDDAIVCPDGFSMADTVPPFCEPWPLGAGGCADPHEARFPGADACAPVGACPAGDFADGLPATGTVYVRAGDSGDGSVGSPFGTIAEGIAAVGRPGVVAIGPGSYDEVIRLPGGVSLIGVCPGRATLSVSTFSTSEAAVSVDGLDAVVRGLTVTAPRRPGVEIGRSASLRLEGVVVRDVYSAGIALDPGANLATNDVIIAEVAARSGSFGGGIETSGATIDLHRTLIEDVNGIGIFASDGGGTLVADGLVMRDVRDDVGVGAGAIQAQSDTSLTLTRSVIESNQTTYAVVANATGATIRLESSVVRNNRAPGSRAGSGAVQALGGGAVTVAGSTLRDIDGIGASVVDEGSALEVLDSLVDSILPSATDPEAIAGTGIEVRSGARLDMRRTRVTNVATVGIQVVGSTAAIEDVLVRGVPGIEGIPLTGRGIQVIQGSGATLSRVEVDTTGHTAIYAGSEGSTMQGDDIVVLRSSYRGIALETGADATLTRVLVDETRQGAVLALADSSLALSDATIRRSAATEDGRFGRGVNIQGSTATLSRIAIDGYANGGIFVAEGATATLEDVVIANGEGSPTTGAYGTGLASLAGSVVGGTRVAIYRAREVGVLAARGGAVELTELDISDTRERACAATTCADAPMGFGVAAVDGRVMLREFDVVDSSLCGVFLSGTSEADFAMGRVIGSRIGACVQVPGFDVDRITSDVIYEENQTNLDATTLPVPEPPEGV